MTMLQMATVAAALAQLGGAAPYDRTPGDPTFDAMIKAQHDVNISAEVDGSLRRLPVREGTRVAEGELLAMVDDREAQAAVEVAQIGLDAAQKRADDDIEERFASAQADVAKADLQKSRDANRKNPNAVPDIEVLQKALVVKRSELQIEKAQKDQVLAGLDANVKQAELHAAKVALERRTVRAPFDGEVQKMFMQEAEWVRAGDPILQLVRFDTLDVECFVNARQYRPLDLANRRVTVRVQTSSDRELAFEGRVVFVSQMVGSNGDFLLRAEIQNKRDGDYWLIQDGVLAQVTIHVSQPPVEAEAARGGTAAR